MGGGSQMQAEFLAIETAVKSGRYDYIHLLSGVDLPLKSQEYIHDFFDKLTPGTNCIYFSDAKHTQEVFERNCRYYYLFTNKTRCRNVFVRKICSLLRAAFVSLQKVFGFQRNWSGMIFGKGTNWVSITYEFAKYLVDNKKKAFRQFRGVLGPDEMWKHSLLLSSSFKNTVAHFEDVSDNLRRIDWNRGTPYTWRKEDFQELVECKELFARKFSSYTDKELIDKIYDHVMHTEKNNSNDAKTAICQDCRPHRA